MNKYRVFLFISFVSAVMVFTSCKGSSISHNSSEEEKTEETWNAIQKNMAHGAEASTERPFPDVLSEQEILLKAIDYARKTGALSPDYFEYQDNPALLTAKIETPVLLYFIPEGTTNVYSLTAVNDDGEPLINIHVRSAVDAGIDSFEVFRATSEPNTPIEYSTHCITKREAIRLIKSQFPDKQVSDPIAVTGLYLEDSPHSNYGVFWYFTVSDTSRNASDESEEYILNSVIRGWKSISGGLSNRAAISGGDSGSPYLNWNRMAKLETPLRIYERIESARNAGSAEKFTGNPVRDIKYTPVPLK